MNTATTISLCVIAKNEEHCLARCLSSAEQIADEIIVIDTGSTDKTVAIATELGADVFFFDWIDDFAAARNYAISKAHGDWILALDADEVLSPLTREELQDLLERSPAEGYYLRICSSIDQGCSNVEDYVVRLFKNSPEYRFVGAIHEQIAGSIQQRNASNGLTFAPFTIYHYGYNRQEISLKHKFHRNTTIIRKALVDNPQDPFLHYSLGIEYLQNKYFEQAGQSFLQAITLLHGNEGYIPQLLIALLLTRLRQPEEPITKELFSKALLTMPENGDICCLYGLWLMLCRNFAEAAEVLEKAKSKSRDWVETGRLSALIGDAYYLAGVNSQAIEYYTNALCAGENLIDLYLLERLLVLGDSKSYATAWEAIGNILSPEMTSSWLRRSQETGRFDLSLAAILLAIVERNKANDIRSIVTLGSTYLQLLKTVTTVSPLQTQIYAILSVDAEVTLMQGKLLELSCNDIGDVKQTLVSGAKRQLALVSLLIQEFSPNDPVRFWQEVFVGETGINCQPG